MPGSGRIVSFETTLVIRIHIFLKGRIRMHKNRGRDLRVLFWIFKAISEVCIVCCRGSWIRVIWLDPDPVFCNENRENNSFSQYLFRGQIE